MHSIWSTRDGECLQINWNEHGQPDDKQATKFSLFIGTIVRDGKNAPLIYKDWHQVPQHYKDHIWEIVHVMKHDFVKYRLDSHFFFLNEKMLNIKDWIDLLAFMIIV